MIDYFNFLKELGYHKFISKSTGESLLIHSYNAYFLLSKLINYIPNLTDSDKKKLIIAALLHDHGKKKSAFQDKLRGSHQVTDEEILEIRTIFQN